MDGATPESPASGFQRPVLHIDGADFFTVVAGVDKALRTYPHYVVLCGLPAGGDHRAVEALVRALARIAPSEPMSFTPVHIDPEEANKGQFGTRYSRTHRALSPHTDSTFEDEPHSIVAFQLVRGDSRGGGRSNIVPVDDIVSRLDDDEVAALRQPQFPFSKDRSLPILWDSGGGVAIRYYRTQIDTVLAERGEEGKLAPLLDRLDTLLSKLAAEREFALADGEVLLLNNQKVLHGRTEMPADSERLLYRFRAHLAAPG